MKRKRLLELLANASVCFDRCMNPFSHSQLVKYKVTLDECRDLSELIALTIRECMRELEDEAVVSQFIIQARKALKDG